MIIGLGHKKQTGKDTVAKILRYITWEKENGFIVDEKYITQELQKSYAEEFNNIKWITMSFADKLKEVASIVFDIRKECWNDPLVKASLVSNYNLTGREILQKIGESFRKEISPDIWVNSLFSSYDSLNYRERSGDIIKPNLIITDVRMPNEAQAIKDRGGILIKINKETGYKDNHISETALDDYDGWDYVIDNNGTLEELINKLEDLHDRTAGFTIFK